MPNINELLAWIDARRRAAAGEAGSLLTSPVETAQRLGGNVAQDFAQQSRGLLDASQNMRSAIPELRQEAQDKLMGGLLNVGFLGSVKGMSPKKLIEGIRGDPGYAYHATNAERLADIATTGKLKTHRPSEFTDQNVWPDAATEKRAYFGASPEKLWQFAPEYGMPVVLRTKIGPHITRESGTGDLFARKNISAKELEYLAEDGKWYSLMQHPDLP